MGGVSRFRGISEVRPVPPSIKMVYSLRILSRYATERYLDSDPSGVRSRRKHVLLARRLLLILESASSMAAIVFGPWRPHVCVRHAGTTIPRSHRKQAASTLIFGTLYKHTHPEMALDRFDYVVGGGGV